MKNKIPNIITTLRILSTVILLFIAPLTVPFYIIYTFGGITDILDGLLARLMKVESEFGAKLDSIADLSFNTVMILKILPILSKKLPAVIWYIVGVLVFMRISSYVIAAVKYKRFSSLHTLFNKFTGLLVFFVPYVISYSIITKYCFFIVIIGAVASLEEMIIHITRKHYASNTNIITHILNSSKNK